MMTLKSGTKWLVGVGVIVVGLGLLLPFAFGLHAQHLLKELDGLRVPIHGGEWGAVEFKVSNQDRGWWHSSATVALTYHIPATDGTSSAGSKPLLTSDVQMIHGPFLWRTSAAEKRPVWGIAWIDAPVFYVAGSLPERFLQITGTETGKARGYISLLGNQTVFINTKEVGFQDIDGQLNFSGLAFEIERSRSGNELVSVLAAPHFNFVLYPKDGTQSIHWLIDGIELQFAGMLDHPAALWYGTWFGEAQIEVDTLQLDSGDQHYAINQFLSKSVHVPGNGSDEMQGETKLKIENISANKSVMGPLEADFTYTNIDRSALEDMRRLYDRWFSADTPLPFISYLTPAQQDEFYADVLEFVNRKPSYKVERFILVTDAGAVSGDFEANITGTAQDVPEVKNIHYWQQNVDARLDLTASQALTENVATWGISRFYAWLNPLLNLPAPAVNPGSPSAEGPAAPSTPAVDYHADAIDLLKQAEMFGFIKSEDNKYYTEALYEKGVLKINGKTLLDLSQKQVANPAAAQQ